MPQKDYSPWIQRNQLIWVFPPEDLLEISEEDGLWYETENEVRRMLALGRKKAHMLNWVRRQMSRKLNPTERRCVRLHYFWDMSIPDIARQQKKDARAIQRTINRAIIKLRNAACLDPQWHV